MDQQLLQLLLARHAAGAPQQAPMQGMPTAQPQADPTKLAYMQGAQAAQQSQAQGIPPVALMAQQQQPPAAGAPVGGAPSVPAGAMQPGFPPAIAQAIMARNAAQQHGQPMARPSNMPQGPIGHGMHTRGMMRIPHNPAEE